MTCEACRPYATHRVIADPADLRAVIADAKAGLDAGVLRLLPLAHPSRDFDEVAAGGSWDDIVGYRFACTACRQQFSLAAETYHGQGGDWTPL